MLDGTETLLTYETKMTLSNKPKNLKFYWDSNKTQEIIVENERYIAFNGFISLEDNKKRDIPIYWEWKLETGSSQSEIDENDIIDSEFMGKTMSMQIATTGKQVMSNPYADAVATLQINGEFSNFNSIQDAINFANQNQGAIITLLKDTNEKNIKINSNQKIFLNTNNKEITISSREDVVLENNGELTLYGNGKLTNAGNVILNKENAILIVKNINIINTHTSFSAVVNSNGYVELIDSSIDAGYRAITNSNNTNGTIIVESGILKSNEYVINAEQGVLVLGKDENSVNASSPLLITTGAYWGNHGGANTFVISKSSEGIYKFYDGILKAPINNTIINGQINFQSNGYVIVYGTEIIDGKEYKTVYLEKDE